MFTLLKSASALVLLALALCVHCNQQPSESALRDSFQKASLAVDSEFQKLSSESVQTLRGKQSQDPNANLRAQIPAKLQKLRNADSRTFEINRDASIALTAFKDLYSQGNSQYSSSSSSYQQPSSSYQGGYQQQSSGYQGGYQQQQSGYQQQYNSNYVSSSNSYTQTLYSVQVPFEYCPYYGYNTSCDWHYKYRSYTGACNNEAFPWWGSSYTPYKRLLPPLYDDGLSAPHLTSVVDGSPLPNPRYIALTLMAPNPTRDIWTVLLTDFSQFIFHDLSFIAAISDDQGNLYKCSCNSRSPNCLSIPIPYGDKYWQYESCIATERSAACYSDFSCKLSEREQLNTVTSWIDMSNVYGNTDADAARLRKAGSYELDTSSWPGIDGPLLPIDPSCGYSSGDGSYPNACFSSGDSRINVNLGLAGLNLLWVREHNRIANLLAKINPSWNIDIVFEEARRINIAGYQWIVYNEWLPIIVGDYQYQRGGFASQYGAQYSYDWDGRIFPNIYNEVAAAVARFGHSMLGNYAVTGDQWNNPSPAFDYSELFYNSKYAFIGPQGIENFMRGCLLYPNERVDPWVTDFVNNYLYINGSHLSLPAMNILRGRDHGLQPYVEYRQLCGLKPVASFDDLDNMLPETVAYLKSTYKYVQDIDLYVGVNAELPLPNSLLGATSACILARQFQELKFADRFWFDFGNDPYVRFRPGQLVELKKNSLARLYCDNFYFQTVLQKPLDVWDAYQNPWVSCSSVPSMNLWLWKERSYGSGNPYYNQGQYNGQGGDGYPYNGQGK